MIYKCLRNILFQIKAMKQVKTKEITEKISNGEKKEIDLRTENKMLEKKTKRAYDLVDDEIKVVTLDNDLVVKLIANNKGVFIDFRKYYKGYPTKKGIRILASKFQEVANIMEPDVRKLVPSSEDLEALNKI